MSKKYFKHPDFACIFEKFLDGYCRQGGGFSYKDDGKFYEIPDPFPAYYKAWVGGEWFRGLFPCITNGQRWNGWAVPGFTYDIALEALKTITLQDMTTTWDEVNQRFVDTDTEGVTYPVRTEEVDGVTYHFVGDGWCWEGCVTADEVGEEFVRVLRDRLKPEEMSAVCAGTAHTDDLCDSNMVMAKAFHSLGIRTSADFDENEDRERQLATDLWNAAWDAAQKHLTGDKV